MSTKYCLRVLHTSTKRRRGILYIVRSKNNQKYIMEGFIHMKKILIMLLFVFTVSLTACSPKVSQEEYDKVIAEKASLQQNYDTLQSDYTKVKANYDSLEKQRFEETKKQMGYSTAKAWVTSSFGDDSIYFVDDDRFLQCISEKKYPITARGVKDAWKDYMASITTLGIFKKDIQYEKIGVKFMSTNNTCLLEIVLKRDNDTYSLDSVMGDLTNSSIVISGIESHLKK